MSKEYATDPLAALHQTMEALLRVDAIDMETMRRFDAACLAPGKGPTPDESSEPTRD